MCILSFPLRKHKGKMTAGGENLQNSGLFTKGTQMGNDRRRRFLQFGFLLREYKGEMTTGGKKSGIQFLLRKH